MSLILVGGAVAAIGISLGVTGIGGFLVPPLLVTLLDMGVRDAIAHALLSFVIPGILGFYLYSRRNSGMWSLSLLMSAGTVPGVLAGRLLSLSVSETALRTLVGLLVFGAGLMLLTMRRTTTGSDSDTARSSSKLRLALAAVAAGFVGGAVAVVAGIGGPLVTVPILRVFGLALAPLVGAALLNSVVAAVLGGASLLSDANIDAGVLIVVTATQIVGMTIGVWMHQRINERRLVPVIAVVSAGIGALLIVQGMR